MKRRAAALLALSAGAACGSSGSWTNGAYRIRSVPEDGPHTVDDGSPFAQDARGILGREIDTSASPMALGDATETNRPGRVNEVLVQTQEGKVTEKAEAGIQADFKATAGCGLGGGSSNRTVHVEARHRVIAVHDWNMIWPGTEQYCTQDASTANDVVTEIALVDVTIETESKVNAKVGCSVGGFSVSSASDKTVVFSGWVPSRWDAQDVFCRRARSEVPRQCRKFPNEPACSSSWWKEKAGAS